MRAVTPLSEKEFNLLHHHREQSNITWNHNTNKMPVAQPQKMIFLKYKNYTRITQTAFILETWLVALQSHKRSRPRTSEWSKWNLGNRSLICLHICWSCVGCSPIWPCARCPLPSPWRWAPAWRLSPAWAAASTSSHSQEGRLQTHLLEMAFLVKGDPPSEYHQECSKWSW